MQFLVSLISSVNDYQQELAKDAEETAKRLGIELKILYAEGDAVSQGQQLLEAIQSKLEKPNAIIFEPAGTALATAARTAAAEGIGWCVMNHSAEYFTDLRKTCRAPMFGLSSDHVEVGRIQGRQLSALLPGGGNVLFLQGSVGHSATQQRTDGIFATKPSTIQLRSLKGQWTEKSGYDAIASWLRLSTSHETRISGVAAQNDDMAMGARRAFQELTTGTEREHWMSIPFLGCDGVPKTGQAHVDRGMMRATVHIPSLSGKAMEMMVHAMKTGVVPPENTTIMPESYPAIESLTPAKFATA
jgi:ribose transport system substrate-binding protein